MPNLRQSEEERRLRDAFARVAVWKAGGQRAPHKPLLLLLALGRIQRGESRLVEFTAVEKHLRDLLRAFGPARKSYHPEYPFWHLQSDKLWEVPGGKALRPRVGHDSPPVSEMRKVSGGLPEDVDRLLRDRPDLLRDVAREILDEHFEPSFQDDLLARVGLSLEPTATSERRARNAQFPLLLLRAYGHRCAICGLDLRLDGEAAAIEAAHVRWHSHGGPDVVENGMALCPLHHKAFDLGALGLTDDRRVLVSQQVQGSEAVEEAFGRFHLRPLIGPQKGQPPVLVDHRGWHYENVFRQPGRPAA